MGCEHCEDLIVGALVRVHGEGLLLRVEQQMGPVLVCSFAMHGVVRLMKPYPPHVLKRVSAMN